MKLNNGIEMPQVGLGTFLLAPIDAENSTREALKMGFQLVDTAAAYVNERAVGRGIKEAGIDRSKIFVSTKLWPSEYTNPNAVDETLERLGLDYVDLLFLHQPCGDFYQGYEQLIKAYQAGKIKAIGVSNFEGKYIEELLKKYDVKPQVFQCECHPLYPQEELREILKPYDIKIMSWYPLGGKGMNAELLEHPVVVSIAKKYNKTPAQIVLRWHVEMGFICIPGSKNVEHLKQNLAVLDFKLSEDDLKEMEKVKTNVRRYIRTEEALERFSHWQPQYETK